MACKSTTQRAADELLRVGFKLFLAICTITGFTCVYPAPFLCLQRAQSVTVIRRNRKKSEVSAARGASPFTLKVSPGCHWHVPRSRFPTLWSTHCSSPSTSHHFESTCASTSRMVRCIQACSPFLCNQIAIAHRAFAKGSAGN